MKLLRTSNVVEWLGVSRSTLWRWTRGGLFPAPIAIGPNAIAWREDEISAWLDARPRRHRPDASAEAEQGSPGDG